METKATKALKVINCPGLISSNWSFSSPVRRFCFQPSSIYTFSCRFYVEKYIFVFNLLIFQLEVDFSFVCVLYMKRFLFGILFSISIWRETKRKWKSNLLSFLINFFGSSVYSGVSEIFHLEIKF